MKLDEILNMPAGREMDALVAEIIFNWEWVKYQAPNIRNKYLTLLAPPNSICSVRSANEYYKFWSPSNRNADRFSDWDKSIYWDVAGVIIHGFPKYSTDIAAAWEVVEKFENQCMLNNVHGIWECYLPRINEPGKSKSAPLAICRAALLAVTETE